MVSLFAVVAVKAAAAAIGDERNCKDERMSSVKKTRSRWMKHRSRRRIIARFGSLLLVIGAATIVLGNVDFLL